MLTAPTTFLLVGQLSNVSGAGMRHTVMPLSQITKAEQHRDTELENKKQYFLFAPDSVQL